MEYKVNNKKFEITSCSAAEPIMKQERKKKSRTEMQEEIIESMGKWEYCLTELIYEIVFKILKK